MAFGVYIYYYRLCYMRLAHVLEGRSSDVIDDVTVKQKFTRRF